MPNAAPRPWRMFLPLAIVLMLALLWSIYWFVASGYAKHRLAAERALLGEKGLALGCTEESWGGYPFHFEFTCLSPVLTYAGKAELRSSRLLLVALAYAPWQIAALLDGPTSVAGPALVPTKIEHQRALAAITFGNAVEPSVSAEFPMIAVETLGRADRLMVHSRPSEKGGTDIAILVTDLLYEPPGRPALAVEDGSLLGTLKPDQTFALEKFELRQGDLRYWGSGTLSLDTQHRITGKVDTETNDIKTLLAAAGPHLGLPDSKLASLRTMLSLLGSDAKAPVIAREGILYLGPFKVTDLPPLF